MTQRDPSDEDGKRPRPAKKPAKALRASLAELYASGGAPKTTNEAIEPRTGFVGKRAPAARVGGAPAALIEDQQRNLAERNVELTAELARLREDGQAVVELAPEALLDYLPADRAEQAFADDAFERLVASIEAHGQDQPVLARPSASGDGLFEIAFGRRRREACRRLGRQVKAIVKPMDDETLLRAMIRENEEREDISAYERARFFRALRDREDLSVRALAKKLDLSPGYLSRLLRLPELPPAIAAILGDPRPLSVRSLESLDEALREPAALDRVVDGWGRLTPAPTVEGRARQVRKLAQTAERGERVRQFRGGDGKLMGHCRWRADAPAKIALAADLTEEQIERVLDQLEAALARERVSQ